METKTTERRVTKVKYDGQKVRIEYQVKRADGGDPDEFTLNSCDRPDRSLVDAMNALTTDVLTICELHDDPLLYTIRGVTLTYTNDILGACITSLKALKTTQSPLVINTPHLPEESYSDDASAPVMHAGMADRLDALRNAAERYIDGERAQGQLFAKDAA